MKKENLKRSAPIVENYNGSDYGSLSDDESAEETLGADKKIPNKRAKLNGSKHELKKVRSAKLTKQPTTEELNRLRETENLFNSNFFRLQIEEILKEVTPKPKYITLFKKWLNDFNAFLNTLEESQTYKLSEQDWLSDMGIEIPIIQEPFENKGHFKFVKNSSTVIGSHAYQCNLGPNITVDLQIEMPKESLHKNDYLNERYLRKRALYLGYLAAKLCESNLVEDLKFKLLNGSSLRPVLSFQPSGKIGKHIRIVLLITAEEEVFKLFRMSPRRNNVREDWRFGNSDIKQETFSAPTPFYNSAVLQDLTCKVNNDFLVKMIGEKENIRQGVLLLKIWLKQRHITTFSGFIMTMFVVHLVQLRRINNAMSSYQVIRNVWTALASSEWDKNGISLFSGEAELHQPAITEFHSYFPVVFVDRSGYYNICSHISMDIYNTIRHESQLAVTYLDNSHINGFLPLFMMPVDFHLKYDHILRIQNTKALRSLVMKEIDKETKLDHGEDTYLLVQKYLSELIHRGLGERISLMASKCLTEEDLSWSLDTKVDVRNDKRKPYIFGFKLNPDYAFNSVDLGPQANLPEAVEFVKFWGAKSELRRFQDGSISEACVWKTSPTVASKRLIIKQIISYLLEVKLGIREKFYYIADQFEFILHNKRFLPADFEFGTGEEATMKLSSSFDSLAKNLRSLTDMPLEINSLYGISPVFSFTDPIPPLPYAPLSVKGFTHSENYRLIRDEVKLRTKNSERTDICSPIFIPALKVIMELSHSGKWPDEIEALRKIKTAFNIQISEALKTQCHLTSHAWEGHVDVIKDGYVFRLEIAHSKEVALMREIVDKDGVTKYRDTEESLEMEYKLLHLPRLRLALNGLHHQNKSYGPAVCLLKRWLRCHMFDSFHFPDICIDMLMAYVFIQPEPFQVPTQPQVAFWRALRMLASVDWNTQIIKLNFNEDLSREEIAEIESNFSSNRATLPAMYFVTPYEGKKPSVWSKSAPTFPVLVRLQMLAAESLNFVDSIIFKQLSDNVKVIFTPNMEGFDVLIHLKAELNPLNYLNIAKPPKSVIKKNNAYVKPDNELFPVVDFDPVQLYLNQLRSSYDEFALFFHDSFGGDVIAVLWKPPALEFKEFKTSLVNGRKLVQRGAITGLIADLDAILDGCLVLGDGLVQDVENKSNVTL